MICKRVTQGSYFLLWLRFARVKGGVESMKYMGWARRVRWAKCRLMLSEVSIRALRRLAA